MRNFLRKMTPSTILSWHRNRKKKKRDLSLKNSQESGEHITAEMLLTDLQKAGIYENDHLLVHSSLSKIGFVKGGAQSVIDALLRAVGEKGNLLMPTSPNAGLQLEYIKDLKVFDVSKDESKLGVISETFRKMEGVKRSAHPTEPVSCYGPDAVYFVDTHFGNLTPYNENSPFYKLTQRKGKILYLGVTLDNAGTNLHTLEDAIENFTFPVYYKDVFEVEVKLEDGTCKLMKTKVHNPDQSKKRKCDELIPLFVNNGVLKKVKIGKADALLVDAKLMLEVMIREYESRGVTMYTPQGS